MGSEQWPAPAPAGGEHGGGGDAGGDAGDGEGGGGGGGGESDAGSATQVDGPSARTGVELSIGADHGDAHASIDTIDSMGAASAGASGALLRTEASAFDVDGSVEGGDAGGDGGGDDGSDIASVPDAAGTAGDMEGLSASTADLLAATDALMERTRAYSDAAEQQAAMECALNAAVAAVRVPSPVASEAGEAAAAASRTSSPRSASGTPHSSEPEVQPSAVAERPGVASSGSRAAPRPPSPRGDRAAHQATTGTPTADTPDPGAPKAGTHAAGESSDVEGAGGGEASATPLRKGAGSGASPPAPVEPARAPRPPPGDALPPAEPRAREIALSPAPPPSPEFGAPPAPCEAHDVANLLSGSFLPDIAGHSARGAAHFQLPLRLDVATSEVLDAVRDAGRAVGFNAVSELDDGKGVVLRLVEALPAAPAEAELAPSRPARLRAPTHRDDLHLRRLSSATANAVSGPGIASSALASLASAASVATAAVGLGAADAPSDDGSEADVPTALVRIGVSPELARTCVVSVRGMRTAAHALAGSDPLGLSFPASPAMARFTRGIAAAAAEAEESGRVFENLRQANSPESRVVLALTWFLKQRAAVLASSVWDDAWCAAACAVDAGTRAEAVDRARVTHDIDAMRVALPESSVMALSVLSRGAPRLLELHSDYAAAVEQHLADHTESQLKAAARPLEALAREGEIRATVLVRVLSYALKDAAVQQPASRPPPPLTSLRLRHEELPPGSGLRGAGLHRVDDGGTDSERPPACDVSDVESAVEVVARRVVGAQLAADFKLKAQLIARFRSNAEARVARKREHVALRRTTAFRVVDGMVGALQATLGDPTAARSKDTATLQPTFNVEGEVCLLACTASYNKKVGRLYVTPRRICFWAGILGFKTIKNIPFARVRRLTRAGTVAGLSSTITVDYATEAGEDKTGHFTILTMERDAVLELLLYLRHRDGEAGAEDDADVPPPEDMLRDAAFRPSFPAVERQQGDVTDLRGSQQYCPLCAASLECEAGAARWGGGEPGSARGGAGGGAVVLDDARETEPQRAGTSGEFEFTSSDTILEHVAGGSCAALAALAERDAPRLRDSVVEAAAAALGLAMFGDDGDIGDINFMISSVASISELSEADRRRLLAKYEL